MTTPHEVEIGVQASGRTMRSEDIDREASRIPIFSQNAFVNRLPAEVANEAMSRRQDEFNYPNNEPVDSTNGANNERLETYDQDDELRSASNNTPMREIDRVLKLGSNNRRDQTQYGRSPNYSESRRGQSYNPRQTENQ